MEHTKSVPKTDPSTMGVMLLSVLSLLLADVGDGLDMVVVSTTTTLWLLIMMLLLMTLLLITCFFVVAGSKSSQLNIFVYEYVSSSRYSVQTPLLFLTKMRPFDP